MIENQKNIFLNKKVTGNSCSTGCSNQNERGGKNKRVSDAMRGCSHKALHGLTSSLLPQTPTLAQSSPTAVTVTGFSQPSGFWTPREDRLRRLLQGLSPSPRQVRL